MTLSPRPKQASLARERGSLMSNRAASIDLSIYRALKELVEEWREEVSWSKLIASLVRKRLPDAGRPFFFPGGEMKERLSQCAGSLADAVVKTGSGETLDGRNRK